MKKFLGAMLVALLFAVPAHADLTSDLNAAFAKQDAAALDAVITNNPGQEGAMGAAVTNQVATLISTNPELASQLMGKSGTLCTANMDQQTADQFGQALRGVMEAVKAANAEGKGADTNTQVLANAMSCAGQPAIVAVHPSLYLEMLAEATQASDETVVQFARQQIARANPIGKNQQPTITLSPEF